MLLKNILLTTFLMMFAIVPAVSQHSEPDGTDNEQATRIITKANFDCFQSLQCLKREKLFAKSNLDEIKLHSSYTDKYVVEGTSKNESLHAVYNGNGDLIEATVIQRNIPLPRNINEILVTGEFQSWRQIGNELVIKNFDPNRMEYKVILQNDAEVRVEYFNGNGQFLNRVM